MKGNGNTIPSSRGTVLMETVLVLPLLLMLITGVVQFARIWQAKVMTWYAAFNAARATLVYHPGDYGFPDAGGDGGLLFMERDGVAWAAAVGTLSWMSHTPDNADDFWMPWAGPVPNSSGIAGQVRVVPEQCWEKNGAVRVTVEFQFPTIFKVADFSDVFAGAGPSAAVGAAWDTLRAPSITLTETCVLPKPWTTGTFPRMHADDKAAVFSTAREGSP